jgi:hypothetical protein
MGLDMYLTKKAYIGAKFAHRKMKTVISIDQGGEKIQINPNRVQYIIEEVGYWRKANHIHNWFVKNVQEGKDDCGEYYVTVEQLKKLLSVCKKIKKNCPLIDGAVTNGQKLINDVWVPIVEEGKEMTNSDYAAKLLPVKSGFFLAAQIMTNIIWPTLIRLLK